MSRVAITVPTGFQFRATVMSHGWCLLAPLSYDVEAGVLTLPLRLGRSRARTVVLSQPGGRGRPIEAVVGSAPLGAAARAALEKAVVHMLRLDADLAGFYARCGVAGPPFTGAKSQGFGRLLRSATLFEDLAKVLATTNTTWAGTKGMVAKLIAVCSADGAFPSPAEVAAAGPDRVRDEARWGYRAAALSELAAAIAGGRLDLGRWESWEGSSEELEREVRDLRGFGPYASANVLMLLGRHDFIGVDTVFRSFVRRRHFPKSRRPPSDRRMMAIYDPWQQWRGLAYWYEMWSDVMENRDLLRAL